jgi:hypothetical protein
MSGECSSGEDDAAGDAVARARALLHATAQNVHEVTVQHSSRYSEATLVLLRCGGEEFAVAVPHRGPIEDDDVPPERYWSLLRRGGGSVSWARG